MSLAHIGNRLRIRGTCNGSVPRGAGHEVMCTDIDAARIAQLQAGGVPIYEEHLEEVLVSARKAGRISYTSDATEAIRFGDAILFAWERLRGRTQRRSFRNRPCRATDCGRGAEFQIDRREEHGPCANRAKSSTGRSRPIHAAGVDDSPWCPIPSSFGKARRFSIFSTPTASCGRGRRSRGNGHA